MKYGTTRYGKRTHIVSEPGDENAAVTLCKRAVTQFVPGPEFPFTLCDQCQAKNAE